MLRATLATVTRTGAPRARARARARAPGPLSQYRDTHWQAGSSRYPRSRPGPIQLDSDLQVELEDSTTARLGGTGTRGLASASGGITTVLL